MRRPALLGPLVLTLSITLSGCSKGREPATPIPSTASAASPAIVIPDGFPLSAGMASEQFDDITTSDRSVGMRALDFCGRKPLRGLSPTDRLAAEVSGNESANTRDLMVFADEETPVAVLEDIEDAASSCPAEPNGPGSRLLTEVRTSSMGSAAATLIHTYEQDGQVGIGAEIIEVVQVGRALLVTSTYAEWDPATNLDDGITAEAARLEETLVAMSIFRNEPVTDGV